MIGPDVGPHDLVEGFIGAVRHGSGVGVDGGVAHEHINLSEGVHCFVHEGLQLILVADVAWHRDGGTGKRRVDLIGDLFTRIGFAAGHHHVGAVLGHAIGDGLADALGGPGDDGRFAAEIEQ